VKGVVADLVNPGLGPATAFLTGFINDGIYHIANFQVSSPLLILVSEALKLLFGYLIVVKVQDGVVLEYMANTVKKVRFVITKFQQTIEKAHVVLKNATNHIKVL
jgi:hypothetical protein